MPRPAPLAAIPLKAWRLQPTSKVPLADVEVPATAPGCVHTDLLAAGLIPDPYVDDNERLLAWVGQASWRYARTLPAFPDADRVDLVCDGLDTVATVRLGDTEVARTQNMHRRYRFDLTPLAEPGAPLQIDFASAIKEADARLQAIGYRTHVNHHPYNGLRKMACSFGWDWGLESATAGIWRPIRLEAWSLARLAGVQVVATPGEARSGTIRVRVTLERSRPDAVTLTAHCGQVSRSVALDAGESEASLELRLDEVELWWPTGWGGQPLYDLDLDLSSGDVVIDQLHRRVGFRTIVADTTPDAGGTPFTLVVNGRAIWVKGVNWIPDDAFPSRVTPARYRDRLAQAKAANCNLVRVWGGGIFEDDAFYDCCDELGLLVWQDFLLACAAYPEEEPYRAEIVAETRDNVARLAHHASLALFNGNNENLWGYEEWQWERSLDGQTWGAAYYHHIFPAIVAELAPTTLYTPGSPWSPGPRGTAAEGVPANDPSHGTVHVWDLWNTRPMADYRTWTPRFVAEFGWQGPPTWSTLTRAVHDDPMTPESPGVIIHQKAADGNGKLTRGLLPNLALPRDMPSWVWAMQWNQAEAVRTALDWWQSLRPHCMGAIVWQLNDCWPAISWAAIDGDGRPKPLLYAIRDAFAPRRIIVEPTVGGLRATVVNDTDDRWLGSLVARRLSYAGELLAETLTMVIAEARGVASVDLAGQVINPAAPASELISVALQDVRSLWWFTTPRHSALEAPEFDVAVDGRRITVTARCLVRDATLMIDRIAPDARLADGMITLLPGETATFMVDADLDADLVRSAMVTLNDLVATR